MIARGEERPDEAAAGSAGGARIAAALERIRTHVARPGEIRHLHTVPARAASPAGTPPALDGRLLEYLEESGLWPLWSHQAAAIECALAGRHSVVASSTSSGKSLCYHLPLLHSLLRAPSGYALLLYPTKALAQDQMRALGGMIERLGLEVEAGIYDGDTEPVMRRRLRRTGRIILTNPDMLHTGILPHHGGWAGLFANLRYIVVDELHTLRGIFGAHAGNLMRRLRRIARHHGSDPVFIATSATIANPAEHAERLLGVPVTVIADDGSPRGEKTYVIWNPPLGERPDGMTFRKGAPSVAVRLLPELVRQGVKSICFGRSRNSVELILRYIGERARRRGAGPALRFEAYRAGYLPNERREIEARLFSGDLGGVVATNALELGIDVGGLDACVIAGWPGTVSSFLQQSGRAGRRNAPSVVFLIGGQEPVDQYFMRHPEALFERTPEHATGDWTNPYVRVRHLLCAAYELPLEDRDREFFGDDLPALAALCGEEGKLREAAGAWYYAERDHPAARVKLRTAADENWTIYELGAERVIGELDWVAGLFSLYEGAVYLHRSETYVVEQMDVVNRVVKIRRTETGYYTQALVEKRVTLREKWDGRAEPGARVRVAEVDVVSRVTGYKKVRFHTTENVGYGVVEVPPLELDTVALAIDLDGETLRAGDPWGPDFLRAGMHGLARLAREMLAIRAMCDPADLDTYIDGARIYLYDLYPGGIGYAEVGFEQYRALLLATLDALAGCPCPAGCPSCVLPGSARVETAVEAAILEYPYPKEAARFILHLLLGLERWVPRLEGVALAAPAPPDPPPRPLDARTERRARKALRRGE